MTGTSIKDVFMDQLSQIKGLEYASNVIYWDLTTGAGSRGVKPRSAALGILSSKIQELMISETFVKGLEALEKDIENLEPVEAQIVAQARYKYERIAKIPPDAYRAYNTLVSEATIIWEEAKRDNDFNLFAPYLKKIVAYKREFADYLGYEDHPYNAHIEDFERGMNVKVLDAFFEELRETVVPLVKAIENCPQPEDDFLYLNYNLEGQKHLALDLLETIGFDMSAGELRESEHPFTMTLAIDDVRLTTHYYPENLTSALFSTIHEGGHGIYEQNFASEIAGTILADGASSGIHESQSRFYENNLGRSPSFWKYFYPKLQKAYKKQLDRVNQEMFVKAINKSGPSFIRIEADELTYPLHIMVRYELEKALIEGSLEVEDLPSAWNEKMTAYLGVTPPTDTLGVLQDVHWSDGLFGYFPSYALGTAYAAQIQHALSKDIDVETALESGDFSQIKTWLGEKIHAHGLRKTAPELIELATGEPFKAEYYTRYLKDKYSALYNL